ncbi:b39.2 [miniopterid betaherpesvirus 1]|uniref:B39.2 n=1 Tax=miniopterid betaherpesvirus 1 TaxID=3070189 RepID=I3VQ17_9BETA|nr:b39.2 [miniopterid betaherpesvirus 1]AFK83861.1 b39.2 [miniopterid betaherpesvirus 1]
MIGKAFIVCVIAIFGLGLCNRWGYPKTYPPERFINFTTWVEFNVSGGMNATEVARGAALRIDKIPIYETVNGSWVNVSLSPVYGLDVLGLVETLKNFSNEDWGLINRTRNLTLPVDKFDNNVFTLEINRVCYYAFYLNITDTSYAVSQGEGYNDYFRLMYTVLRRDLRYVGLIQDEEILANGAGRVDVAAKTDMRGYVNSTYDVCTKKFYSLMYAPAISLYYYGRNGTHSVMICHVRHYVPANITIDWYVFKGNATNVGSINQISWGTEERNVTIIVPTPDMDAYVCGVQHVTSNRTVFVHGTERSLLPGRPESRHFNRAIYVKWTVYVVCLLTVLLFGCFLIPRRVVSFYLELVTDCTGSCLRKMNVNRIVYQERVKYALWGRDITDSEACLVEDYVEDRTFGVIHFITLPSDEE